MDKLTFGGIAIVVVGSIQVSAHACGVNGQVFAFTSLVIGAVIGAGLGIKLTMKKT